MQVRDTDKMRWLTDLEWSPVSTRLDRAGRAHFSSVFCAFTHSLTPRSKIPDKVHSPIKVPSLCC